MKVYRYELPFNGPHSLSSASLQILRDHLEENLKDGPDCLMAWCIFPPDGEVVEKAAIDMRETEDGIAGSIVLTTYSKLYHGCEKELLDCVAENLKTAAEETANRTGEPISLKLDGGVLSLGLTGDMPDTLYHITEASRLPDIKRQGLVPGNGRNHYKDMDAHTYLCEEKDLAAWLCVLPHVKNPVILKIDAASLDSIESGRFFNDRDAFPEGYGEYRTGDPIPPSAVAEVNLAAEPDLRERLSADLRRAVRTGKDSAEVAAGLARFANMGLKDLYNTYTREPEKAPGWEPLKGPSPWDDPDAFEEAVADLPWDDLGASQTK